MSMFDEYFMLSWELSFRYLESNFENIPLRSSRFKLYQYPNLLLLQCTVKLETKSLTIPDLSIEHSSRLSEVWEYDDYSHTRTDDKLVAVQTIIILNNQLRDQNTNCTQTSHVQKGFYLIS